MNLTFGSGLFNLTYGKLLKTLEKILGTPDVSPAPKAFLACMTLKWNFKVPV